jgi:hypothetical protein
MSAKPAHTPVDAGPVTHGKGLDSLEGFIIHNWAPPTRFGIWSKRVAALAAPKASLTHFLDESLHAAWKIDGSGAVLTIHPPSDPLVTIRVESEHKGWTPESKYNPKHWLWKVVPAAKALPDLEEAARLPSSEPEAHYLQGLLEGQRGQP